MRDFRDIAAECKLKVYLEDCPSGVVYFPKAFDPRETPILVYRFETKWPPGLIAPYIDMVRAAQRWIETRPELSRLIRVDQPIEVGRDFVAFRHHLSYTSTNAYSGMEEESLAIGSLNPWERPPELEEMRAIFRSFCNVAENESEVIVRRALARSILNPSIYTFFQYDEGQFVIAQLEITKAEIECWSELMR